MVQSLILTIVQKKMAKLRAYRPDGYAAGNNRWTTSSRDMVWRCVNHLRFIKNGIYTTPFQCIMFVSSKIKKPHLLNLTGIEFHWGSQWPNDMPRQIASALLKGLSTYLSFLSFLFVSCVPDWRHHKRCSIWITHLTRTSLSIGKISLTQGKFLNSMTLFGYQMHGLSQQDESYWK